MEFSSSKVNELKREIVLLFSSVECPLDDNLVDNLNSIDPDVKRTHLAFMGKNWPDILDYISDPVFSDGIHYLTNDAFRYYLPAYLIGVLDGGKSDLAYSVVLFLTPHKCSRFLQNVEWMSLEQQDLVKTFLELISTKRGSYFTEKIVNPALNEYWSLPAEEKTDLLSAFRDTQFPLPSKAP